MNISKKDIPLLLREKCGDDFETEKIVDPEKRYAWRVKKEFEDGFVKKGLALAEEYGRSV